MDPAAFQSLGKVEPGMKVSTTLNGQPTELVITEVHEDEIVLDGNHPLAGHDLVFDVQIESVESADLSADNPDCGCSSSCGCGGH
jgi:FKBP-type peptidyl-prolyl cis-trans isomerase 2